VSANAHLNAFPEVFFICCLRIFSSKMGECKTNIG